MEEQGKISNNQCTTIPLADGWYLRDSKSNPGRKYYFNPTIKQSFWHITDDEIKVLEKKTKDQTSGTKNSKPSNFVIPLEECNTSGPKAATIMHPIVRYNELPYDPSIWAVPPAAEIMPTVLINPINTIPSLPNQTAFSMTRSTLQSNIPHDTNQVPNKNRFPSNVNNCQQSTKPRKYNQSHAIVGDLRDELKNRRIQPSNPSGSRVNTKRRSFENVTWDEEAVKDVLQFLIRKIAPEANQDCWYVVPDVNVVEKHSTLLSMMTNLVHTDIVKRCCLKVPPFVMMKLKDIAEEPGNISIRRFMRFHCTETLSESQSNAEHNETASIKETCMKLLEDNYHVVVLCQDLLFKDLRMSLTNPVFTIPKLMLFIENFKRNKVSQETVLSKKVEFDKNTANDKNNSQVILPNAIENSSSSIKSKMSYEELHTAVQTNEENDSKSISSNSVPQINPIILDHAVEQSNTTRSIVLSLNQHAVSNKSPQKRKIKLKRTCDTNISSGQTSVKRRWSAINTGKKTKVIGSAEAVQCSQNDDDTENKDKDNLLKETKIEYKYGPKKELPKEDNDYSKILSSSESCFIAASTTPASSITEYNVDNIQNETNSIDVCQSSLSTTKECNDEKCITIDETTIESLATQETKYVTWYLDLIENILLRVLHKNPIVMKDLPQLQRLHKATIEIIKNYSHCCYVVDAANKLSMKLDELSKKGAININKKFLEDADIYSHVVNLIKSLEDVNKNDEDIQSAKSLLKNILQAIHKPSVNVADQLQETSAADSQHNKGSEDITDAPISELEITPSVENESHIQPENNDFNANKRKLEEAAKIKHFRALKLRKVDHNLPRIISNEDSGIFNDSTNKGNKLFGKTATTESTEENINSLEIEEDNKLDIEYEGEVIEPQDFLNENKDSNLPITNNADNEKFKLFIAMFLKEIRETFLVCAQYVETCLTQENGKNVVNDEINEVYGILCKILQSLDSIVTRDSGDVNNNFKSVLNKAGFNINIDQNTCDEYRDIVYKCKDEVKAFLNLIESRRVND